MLCSNIIFCKSSGRSEYLVPLGRPGMTFVSETIMSLTISYDWVHCVFILLKTLNGFIPRTIAFVVMIVVEKNAACVKLRMSRFFRLGFPPPWINRFVKLERWRGYLNVAYKRPRFNGIRANFLVFQLLISGSNSFICFSVSDCMAKVCLIRADSKERSCSLPKDRCSTVSASNYSCCIFSKVSLPY